MTGSCSRVAGAAIALLLLAPSTAPAQNAVQTVPPKRAAIAESLIHQAQANVFDRSLLDARLKGMISSASPASMKGPSHYVDALGHLTAFSFLRSQRYTSAITHREDDAYTFLATFAHGQIDWWVAFDAEGKVSGFLLWPYVAPMDQAHLIHALQTHLQHESKAGTFAGAVLLARNGVPVFSQAYGLADRARHIQNGLDTRFRIGSMNKMFTAVATLQLVQAGKIDLNAPLATYLPDYPNKALASTVTIHQLLTHTGGTGDIFGPDFDRHRLQLRTLDDYVKLYGDRALKFKPGSKFDYSNYGFILLGVVIEKASGESYYDYVRDHVYARAGMISSGSDPEDQAVADRSLGYTVTKKHLVSNADTLPYRGTSAGGGYSTVGDLLRFANALEGDKLLDAHYTQLLTTGKVDMPSGPDNPRQYAYGFGDDVIDGIRCIGHNGGAPGMSGILEMCPATGYTIAVLSNLDPPAADQISDFITSRQR
jgi:CubicO group peptidase (beta-lactamase class C family)